MVDQSQAVAAGCRNVLVLSECHLAARAFYRNPTLSAEIVLQLYSQQKIRTFYTELVEYYFVLSLNMLPMLQSFLYTCSGV